MTGPVSNSRVRARDASSHPRVRSCFLISHPAYRPRVRGARTRVSACSRCAVAAGGHGGCPASAEAALAVWNGPRPACGRLPPWARPSGPFRLGLCETRSDFSEPAVKWARYLNLRMTIRPLCILPHVGLCPSTRPARAEGVNKTLWGFGVVPGASP